MDKDNIEIKFLVGNQKTGIYTWSKEEPSWLPVCDLLDKVQPPVLVPNCRGLKLKFNETELVAVEKRM